MALAWNITAPWGCCWFGPCVTSEECKTQICIHTAFLQPQLWGQRFPLQRFLFYFIGVQIRRAHAAALMSLMKLGRLYSWWHEHLITRQTLQQQQDCRKEIRQRFVFTEFQQKTETDQFFFLHFTTLHYFLSAFRDKHLLIGVGQILYSGVQCPI